MDLAQIRHHIYQYLFYLYTTIPDYENAVRPVSSVPEIMELSKEITANFLVHLCEHENLIPKTNIRKYLSTHMAPDNRAEETAILAYGDNEFDNNYKQLQRLYKNLSSENNNLREQNNVIDKIPPISTLLRDHDGRIISHINAMTVYMMNDFPLYQTLRTKNLLDIKKVSHSKFIELYQDYEEKISKHQKYHDDLEFLINTVHYYTLETKSLLHLLSQIATFMDEHDYTINDLDGERTRSFWGIIEFEGKHLEANSIMTNERFIPYVFNQCSPKTYQTTWNKYYAMRIIKFIAFNYAISLYYNDYTNNNITTDDAIKFFKQEYNLLEHHLCSDFGTFTKPNTKRINFARHIASELYNR